MPDRWRLACAVSVGLPPLLLGLLALALLLAAGVGFQPLWPTSTLTLSEAAYLGDDAAVARMVMAGADINARAPVRAGMLEPVAVSLRPLGAALAGGQVTTTKTLVKLGARVESVLALRAACLAHERGDERLLDLLRQAGIVVYREACGP